MPEPAHGFVACAEAAGVQRPALLSGRGADTGGDSTFGLDMRLAEDAVRGSALEWTVLRSNNFQQNFDEEFAVDCVDPARLGAPGCPVAPVPRVP